MESIWIYQTVSEGLFSETRGYKVGVSAASRGAQEPQPRPPSSLSALARLRRCDETLLAVATCYTDTARKFLHIASGLSSRGVSTDRDNGRGIHCYEGIKEGRGC